MNVLEKITTLEKSAPSLTRKTSRSRNECPRGHFSQPQLRSYLTMARGWLIRPRPKPLGTQNVLRALERTQFFDFGCFAPEAIQQTRLQQYMSVDSPDM